MNQLPALLDAQVFSVPPCKCGHDELEILINGMGSFSIRCCRCKTGTPYFENYSSALRAWGDIK